MHYMDVSPMVYISVLAKEISLTTHDILPEVPWVVTLVATAFTLISMRVLHSQWKKEKRHGSGLLITFVVFVLVRMAMPISLSTQNLDAPLDLFAFALVSVATVVSPFASLPALCFLCAEYTLSLVRFDYHTHDTPSMHGQAAEIALLSAVLCVIHDMVATRLLWFVENSSKTATVVFVSLATMRAVHSLVSPSSSLSPNHALFSLDLWSLVSLQLPEGETPEFYFLRLFPPVGCAAMTLRTLAQKRVKPKEFLVSCGLGGLLWAVCVYQRSMNAYHSTLLVSATMMLLTSGCARGRKSKLPQNVWLVCGILPELATKHVRVPEEVELEQDQVDPVDVSLEEPKKFADELQEGWDAVDQLHEEASRLKRVALQYKNELFMQSALLGGLPEGERKEKVQAKFTELEAKCETSAANAEAKLKQWKEANTDMLEKEQLSME